MLRLMFKPAFHGTAERFNEIKSFFDRNEDVSYKEIGKLSYHYFQREFDLVRLREARDSVVKRNEKITTLTEVIDFRNELNNL